MYTDYLYQYRVVIFMTMAVRVGGQSLVSNVDFYGYDDGRIRSICFYWAKLYQLMKVFLFLLTLLTHALSVYHYIF